MNLARSQSRLMIAQLFQTYDSSSPDAIHLTVWWETDLLRISCWSSLTRTVAEVSRSSGCSCEGRRGSDRLPARKKNTVSALPPRRGGAVSLNAFEAGGIVFAYLVWSHAARLDRNGATVWKPQVVFAAVQSSYIRLAGVTWAASAWLYLSKFKQNFGFLHVCACSLCRWSSIISPLFKPFCWNVGNWLPAKTVAALDALCNKRLTHRTDAQFRNVISCQNEPGARNVWKIWSTSLFLCSSKIKFKKNTHTFFLF